MEKGGRIERCGGGVEGGGGERVGAIGEEGVVGGRVGKRVKQGKEQGRKEVEGD